MGAKLITMPRGNGEILKSAPDNISIVVPYKRNVERVKNMAMSIGVKIPGSITVEEIHIHGSIGSHEYNSAIIDDVFSNDLARP